MEAFIISSIASGLLYDILKENFLSYSEKVEQHLLLKYLSKKIDKELTLTASLIELENDIINSFAKLDNNHSDISNKKSFKETLLKEKSVMNIKNYIETMNVSNGGNVTFE